MALARVRTLCLLLTVSSMLIAGRSLAAQATGARPAADSVTISTSVVDNFAKAFLAVSALRSQLQGELADPAAKKPDRQSALQAKLQEGIAAILQQHGLGTAEFAVLTRRVSTDDVLRKSFEEAVARLSAAKGAGAPPGLTS